MAVRMNDLVCPMKDRCKFRNGCILVKSAEEGARFSPTLKLRLEGLRWYVKCFSFTEDSWKND